VHLKLSAHKSDSCSSSGSIGTVVPPAFAFVTTSWQFCLLL
jgi:hypothetical protein